MDLFQVAQNYLDKILDNPEKGVRVLLLDQHTSTVISMISTQSELLKHEIYLIDKIENEQRDKLRTLKCVCFIKPTTEVISLLTQEMLNPKYSTYELYFNNIISKPKLERLAEADDLEVVSKVVELFEDYLIINRDLYSFNIPRCLSPAAIDSWVTPAFNQTTESLLSLLLSLKCKPIIRYEKNSKMASKLANGLVYDINENQQLFNTFPKKDTPPLLLLLDRKNDPITPLLVPWTFQSMVHELIGINNNTVDLSHVDKISDELKTVVLSSHQDSFYKESMYLNFGDLSEKIKKYVDQYKAKTKSNSNVDSVQDMKKFLESYPEFRKFSLNVAKHMALASELDRKINADRLWEISELEQSLSCLDNHNADVIELERLLLNNPSKDQPASINQKSISDEAKVRLVALYALRYQNHNGSQLVKLKNILATQGIPPEQLIIIDILLNYAGSKKRLEDSETSIFGKATSNLISGFKQHHENDNIFMQHVPRVESVISKATRGKLSAAQYPILVPDGTTNVPKSELPVEKAQEIIIFIVGGITYEEARIVANLNSNNKSVKIVIGGTSVLSTSSFIQQLSDAGYGWGGSGGASMNANTDFVRRDLL